MGDEDVDRRAREILAGLDRESVIFALCVMLAANRDKRRLTEGQTVEATGLDRLVARVMSDYGAEALDAYDAIKRNRRPPRGH